MVKKNKANAAFVILVLILFIITGCDKNNNDNTGIKDNNDSSSKEANSTLNDYIIGFYEGTVNQSGENVLTSLNLKEDKKYEFYISNMGLIDTGCYDATENSIKFISDITSSESIGTYDNGRITSDFSVNNSKQNLSFDQVGTPDDFYKFFLGDYTASDSGNNILVLSLRENKQFEISSTDYKGSFDIINGSIDLMDNNCKLISKGNYNTESKEITITLKVNNLDNEYVFCLNSENSNISFYGASTVGMSGNTPVTLIIKPAKRFELATSKPRGIGVYEIGEKIDNGFKISFTYTDPSTRPDGSMFVLAGTISTDNINDPEAIITIDQVEYVVDMGNGSASTMNLGKVEFSTVSPDAADEQSSENEAADNTTTEPEEANSSDAKESSDVTEPKDEAEPKDESETAGSTEATEEQQISEEPNDGQNKNDINVVGQYATTVMGTTEVIMDLKEDGSYELSTGENGVYSVSEEGIIYFTPGADDRNPYDTKFDNNTQSFIIKFSIINGTPESEYVFKKK